MKLITLTRPSLDEYLRLTGGSMVNRFWLAANARPAIRDMTPEEKDADMTRLANGMQHHYSRGKAVMF